MKTLSIIFTSDLFHDETHTIRLYIRQNGVAKKLSQLMAILYANSSFNNTKLKLS